MDTQNAFDERQRRHDRFNELKAFDEGKLGVKGLVDAGIKKIPRMFVRPLEDRLKYFATCTDNISVPIIDLANFGENKDQTAEIAKEIIKAAKEWGFFQVINHGISKEFLETMINRSRMFHEQDVETKKMFYSRDFQSKPVFFISNYDLYHSNAANWRNTLYVNARQNGGIVDPQELPPICRDVMLEYINHIHNLGDRILMLISLGLGIEPECLGNIAKCNKSWAIVNSYYPACPEPELTMGIDAHVDTTFVTILLQDNIGGLQVLYENKWVNIEPVTGGLIVNFGKILHMITNDIIKGASHRVIAKKVGPRQSIAFNFNGVYSSEKIHGPIKELTSEENPPIYRKFSTEELIKSFLSKSLNEVGDNLDDFKLQHHGDGL
ncbi:1-aminocyclopropane-1-carboxylate oxidase homolog 1-like [Chenopodium quinoa]|uniref:1-aminocyclopropane-1-carboxylate oxidase homolog 1-like n=1 Tax=Chenopodium quinoa TaxID=63459 RepID=UPI000B77DD0D|nr:1-aminocyclopropane-1-carboxylate oxidase homolog 1-like [Chenopodium quinoa]